MPDKTPNSPCPRCDVPVTIQRCMNQHSRWYGGWEIACWPCGRVYAGADNKAGAEHKAQNLKEHLR